jgi:hypothetical protein
MAANEYLFSLLSESSYANLKGVTTKKQLENALIISGFSEKQAKDSATHWRVADHYSKYDYRILSYSL